ncbi:Na+/H+ antiporter subunit C [Candidatus Binatia bacterium]|nr:Na+/H+ antiporter subunit C [Candidatus Binatia bacterium]
MELLLAITIGAFVATGSFMLMRPRAFSVVQGFVLLSHGVNLLLVSMGRVQLASPPIVGDAADAIADPLAQALVLTAIVISFGMTAFVLVLAYRSYQQSGTEHVDLGGKHV